MSAWRNRSGQPVFRESPADVWPLEFEDRPRIKPEPQPENVVPLPKRRKG